MPPFIIKYFDSDPTTIYLRQWIQPLIDENNRAIRNGTNSNQITIHLPQRNIINSKKQKKLHKKGIYNYIRIWNFVKIDKYSIYEWWHSTDIIRKFGLKIYNDLSKETKTNNDNINSNNNKYFNKFYPIFIVEKVTLVDLERVEVSHGKQYAFTSNN